MSLFTSDNLYTCEPEYIEDTPDEPNPRSKERVQAFRGICMARLSNQEKMMIQRNIATVEDMAFYSYCVLNLPAQEILEGFKLVNPAETPAGYLHHRQTLVKPGTAMRSPAHHNPKLQLPTGSQHPQAPSFPATVTPCSEAQSHSANCCVASCWIYQLSSFERRSCL